MEERISWFQWTDVNVINVWNCLQRSTGSCRRSRSRRVRTMICLRPTTFVRSVSPRPTRTANIKELAALPSRNIPLRICVMHRVMPGWRAHVMRHICDAWVLRQCWMQLCDASMWCSSVWFLMHPVETCTIHECMNMNCAWFMNLMHAYESCMIHECDACIRILHDSWMWCMHTNHAWFINVMHAYESCMILECNVCIRILHDSWM